MLEIKFKKEYFDPKWLTPFVDRATKCLATAAACGNASVICEVDCTDQRADGAAGKGGLTSLACSRNHALADSALVMVSWVVKVFRKESKAVSLPNAAQHS